MVGALALVGILLVVYFLVFAGGPSYSVVTTGTDVITNDQVVAFYLVRNTGTAKGTPTCEVRIHGPGGVDSNVVTVLEKTALQPGKVHLYATRLTVPPNTAHYVKDTYVLATCT